MYKPQAPPLKNYVSVKEKAMKTRILSLLLALCMVLILLPATALATEAAPSEVTLTTSIKSKNSENAWETITKDVTIDAGATLYANVANDGTVTSLETEEGANLIVDNSQAEAVVTLKSLSLTGCSMKFAGSGALKIVVDGDSSIKQNNGAQYALNVLTLGMQGGTTITSLNDSKLTVQTTHTSS